MAELLHNSIPEKINVIIQPFEDSPQANDRSSDVMR